jgi:hypothetical protein
VRVGLSDGRYASIQYVKTTTQLVGRAARKAKRRSVRPPELIVREHRTHQSPSIVVGVDQHMTDFVGEYASERAAQ